MHDDIMMLTRVLGMAAHVPRGPHFVFNLCFAILISSPKSLA
jgi:hypothetical protein